MFHCRRSSKLDDWDIFESLENTVNVHEFSWNTRWYPASFEIKLTNKPKWWFSFHQTKTNTERYRKHTLTHSTPKPQHIIQRHPIKHAEMFMFITQIIISKVLLLATVWDVIFTRKSVIYTSASVTFLHRLCLTFIVLFSGTSTDCNRENNPWKFRRYFRTDHSLVLQVVFQPETPKTERF